MVGIYNQWPLVGAVQYRKLLMYPLARDNILEFLKIVKDFYVWLRIALRSNVRRIWIFFLNLSQ